MALLTLANLLSDVQDEIPGKEQAAIVRAVNKVVRRIYTEFVEPQEGTFTTLPAVTTGAVGATQDSTTVEFTDNVLNTTDPLRFISIEGESVWFGLTRTDANTGVLSSKWALATNLTATYTIVYPTISFPSGVGEILNIGQNGSKLFYRIGTAEQETPWWTGIGSGLPTHWGPYTHDESGTAPNDELLRVVLTPGPSERRVYQYTYKPRVTFLDSAGATSQVIPLQDRWYESIVEGVLFHTWKQESRAEKALAQEGVFERALSRARGASNPGGIISPRRRASGMWVYESRPIG